MAELKTKPNDGDVDQFIAGIQDENRRRDCRRLLQIMERVCGIPPQMWGDSIVGFGIYRYEYPSGRSGEWFRTGFSPRKQNLTVYLTPGLPAEKALLDRLGKHTTGKGCLYFKRLSDLDEKVLEKLIAKSAEKLPQ